MVRVTRLLDAGQHQEAKSGPAPNTNSRSLRRAWRSSVDRFAVQCRTSRATTISFLIVVAAVGALFVHAAFKWFTKLQYRPVGRLHVVVGAGRRRAGAGALVGLAIVPDPARMVDSVADWCGRPI